MIEKISVVIITRNRAKMLVNCLDSLVAQTRIPNEVIVVDNASTDKTKEMIISFRKKLPIRYVQELQIGIPYARNKGIQEASGTILLMLDDDCQADKFWVERMIDAHKKYPKAWVIQGRTYSLPKERLYSLAIEFSRLLYVRNSAKKIVSVRSFFRKYFTNEIELLMCETKNVSIKTPYLKKYKFSFDTHFYRGEDTDLGKQILQKNGLIIFCPSAQVYHWERSSLAQFLEQQWHIGRSTAKIANKWGTLSVGVNTSWPDKFLSFLYFCKVFNFRKWYKLPIFTLLLFLDKLYRLNGYFFEKRTPSPAKL